MPLPQHFSNEEDGNDDHFKDLEDEQFFCDPEEEATGRKTSGAEVRLNISRTETEAKHNPVKRGREPSHEESSEDEVDREVRELNREPKPKKKNKQQVFKPLRKSRLTPNRVVVLHQARPRPPLVLSFPSKSHPPAADLAQAV